MIYVSQDNLNEVEYLLKQSTMGNHILFDSESIKQCLTQKKNTTQSAQNAESQLERLMSLKGLSAKHRYLESLPRQTQLTLCQLYLNVVDHFLQDKLQNSERGLIQ